MEKERSLGMRAFLAVVLFFGFYLLAVSVAAGLLFIAYLLCKTFNYFNWISFSCLALAAIILWSITPRRDKLEAPGPRLIPDQHPRFFKAIETIARDLGQAMPRYVYLIPVANAWVASRGGFMGIGSRRIMAVGIPLLQTLSVPQLTAVLAHEFGHYCGGDVKLGPWIYKTRLAIARTVLGLQMPKSILQILFVWYGNAFLKITSSISRGQELAADRMATSVAGATNVASALRNSYKTLMNFGVYWQRDVVPVLAKGFCPPIVTGFGQFLSSEAAKRLKAGFLEKPSRTVKPDRFDTQPTLDDRLAALKESPREEKEQDSDLDVASASAMTLLNKETPEIEQELIAWIQARQKQPLTAVSWQEVGQKVWPEIWKEGAARLAVDLVRPITLADFPRLIQKEVSIPVPAEAPPSDLVPQEFRRILWIVDKYGSALANAMIKTGWNPEVLPGSIVKLEKGNLQFMPFEFVSQLAHREMDEETWRKLCRNAGISDLPLFA